MFRRIPIALFAASAAFALACSDAAPAGPSSQTKQTDGTGTPTDSVNTHLPVHTPAVGPMASLRLLPDTVTIWPGYVYGLSAQAYNAQGEYLNVVQATWSSSDASVASVKDTGVVYGNAPGTAIITATSGGFTATAKVVVSSSARVGGNAYVAINLTGIAIAGVAGGDTSLALSAGTRLAGLTATVYRTATTDGTPVTPAIQVATGVTDGSGRVTFNNLPAAFYRLVFSAPAGGAYMDGSAIVGPSTTASVTYSVVVPHQ